MKTYLIIHTKWQGYTSYTNSEAVNSFDLGVLIASEARVVALKLATSHGVRPEDLCHTPKIVGGVRFYIGVVR